jgi:hypothetical protein
MANTNNAKQWRYFNLAVFVAIAYLSFFHKGPTWSGTFYEAANGFTKVGFQEFFGFLFVYMGFTALVSYCAFWSIMSSGQKNILNVIVALAFIPVGVYIIFQELVTDVVLLASVFYPFIFAALLYGTSPDSKNRIMLKSDITPSNTSNKKKSLMDDFTTAAKVKGGKLNTTSLNQSIKMAHEQLLGEIVPKAKVTAIAQKLNDGPMSYSHDDLAFSVALNFFKNKAYIDSLSTQQMVARLTLIESINKKMINPLLAAAFEDALYKLYK